MPAGELTRTSPSAYCEPGQRHSPCPRPMGDASAAHVSVRAGAAGKRSLAVWSIRHRAIAAAVVMAYAGGAWLRLGSMNRSTQAAQLREKQRLLLKSDVSWHSLGNRMCASFRITEKCYISAARDRANNASALRGVAGGAACAVGELPAAYRLKY